MLKHLRFLETVKLKVEDLKIDDIKPISPGISLKMAWNIMKDKNIKSIPVVMKMSSYRNIFSF